MDNETPTRIISHSERLFYTAHHSTVHTLSESVDYIDSDEWGQTGAIPFRVFRPKSDPDSIELLELEMQFYFSQNGDRELLIVLFDGETYFPVDGLNEEKITG